MARRGYPPEFRRRVVELVEGGRKLAEVAADLGIIEQTVYAWRRRARIEAGFGPGSPWENGYVESFGGKLRDDRLNGAVFETLLEAQVLIERWRHEYDTFRPHSSLG